MAEYEIKTINIDLLKQHEEICEIHLEKLLEQIENDGFISDPIIADKKQWSFWTATTISTRSSA